MVNSNSITVFSVRSALFASKGPQNQEARPTKIDMDGWKEKVFRRSHSKGTVDIYTRGLDKFAGFLSERMPGYDLERAVTELQGRDPQLDVYKLLDRFVSWAVSQTDAEAVWGTGRPVMPRTVKRWLEGTKSFLRYHDVLIINEVYQTKVTEPMAQEIPDEVPDKATIRKILLSNMPLWARAATAAMASSGMRIGECMQLTVGDIHFDETPARIHIRAETTKATKSGGRMARDTFITNEAVDFLKQQISQRGLNANDLVFYPGKLSKGTRPDNEYRMTLYRWLPKLGLDEKIPGHRYGKIHAHVFRKFFRTNAGKPMGVDATEALMGHQGYLKTYVKLGMERMRTDYRTAIPALCVLSETSEEAQKKAAQIAAWKSVGLNDAQIEALQTIQKEKGLQLWEPNTEVDAKLKEWLLQSWGYGPRRPSLVSAGVW